MLTKRIIPCLDVKDGRVVKGVSFVELRDAGDPVELAKFYDAQGADELVFLVICDFLMIDSPFSKRGIRQHGHGLQALLTWRAARFFPGCCATLVRCNGRCSFV